MSQLIPSMRRLPASTRTTLPASPSSRPRLSGGQSLNHSTQREMSARFGHSFSQVRIHSDPKAAESAEAVGAHAYAFGSDIVFGAGKYQPGSRETERLLAHELTHVVQQDRYGQGTTDLKSRRSDPSEQEAEIAADRVVSGERVDVQSAPRAALSCFDPSKNDVKDDFWNTKSTWGKQTGSVVDSAINTAWDGIGLIPGVGSLLSTGVDLAKAGYSEGMSTVHGWEADATGSNAERMRATQYDEAAGSFMKDAGVDATGMIPVYGTGQGVLGGLWDGARTIDLARGADPDGSPSFGDLQKKGGEDAWNAVNPPAPAAAPDQAPNPDLPPPNMPADPLQQIP